MIKLSDAGLLALTKLRARKLRTVITVLLAGVLFGVLAMFSLVSTGLFRSISLFREAGLTSRYIVEVFNAPADVDEFQRTMRDPKLLTEAKKRYEAIVKQKIAEAKRLGLEYSHTNDQPPYTQSYDGSLQLSINDPNGITRQLLREKYSATPAFDDTRLSEIAKQYHAVKVFAEESYAIKHGSVLSYLQDGKEIFYDSASETEAVIYHEAPPIDASNMTIVPVEITESFMLPNNAGWQPDGKSLPIILPQDRVEQLLGLEKLPASATPEQKFERLKVIRQTVIDLSFNMCYRNEVSQSRIQQAIQQKKEMIANKDNKDYQKPKLIYELPDPTKCEEAKVSSDTRTAEEIRYDKNQEIFDRTFGKETAGVSKFMTFKVVGLSPGNSAALNPEKELYDDKARTAGDIIREILSTEAIGQAVPRDLYDQLPNKGDYAELLRYDPWYIEGNEDNKRRFVEFADANDAQKFIDEQSCTVQYDNTCKPLNRPYQANFVFSNSAALDDMQKLANQWSLYGLVVCVVLATAIMWITVGRMIVDGRHETAVFRAIGFKRSDIVAVYVLYVAVLSVCVAGLAMLVGIVGAFILDNQFALTLTAQAQYGFGIFDDSRRVNLVGFDSRQLCIIFAACVMTGFVSAIVPLLRNVRRSPLRDMREE